MSSGRPSGNAAPPPRLSVSLHGVPETALWTLYLRAHDAGRPGSRLRDPKAAELVEAIDYPFEARFAMWALFGMEGYLGERALTLDREIRQVLAVDPAAVVVSLGEGLETQFWRVDNGRLRWFGVELPEMAAVRRRLLGEDPPRRRLFAGSALEEGWVEALDATDQDRVVVVAQGLLMYLQPAEVEELIIRCARRFRRGVFLFDTVPSWFAWMSRRGLVRSPSGYCPPPMPWGLDAGDHRELWRLHRNIVGVRTVSPADSPGTLTDFLLPVGRFLPGIRRGMPAVVRLDFAR